MGGHLPQQRLDVAEVTKHAAEFIRCLAVRLLVLAASRFINVSERALSSDGQQTDVFGGQQLGDGLLTPLLPAVRKLLGPTIVGIDGLVLTISARQ